MQPFPLCNLGKNRFLIIRTTGCGFPQFHDTSLKYRPALVCNAYSFYTKRFRKWKSRCCLLHCHIHIRHRKDKSVYSVLLPDGMFFHLFSCLTSFCAALIGMIGKNTQAVRCQGSAQARHQPIYMKDKAAYSSVMD